MRVRVENAVFLERETSSSAVLNSDINGWKALMENKKRKTDADKNLRNEIAELKALVAQLIKDK